MMSRTKPSAATSDAKFPSDDVQSSEIKIDRTPNYPATHMSVFSGTAATGSIHSDDEHHHESEIVVPGTIISTTARRTTSKRRSSSSESDVGVSPPSSQQQEQSCPVVEKEYVSAVAMIAASNALRDSAFVREENVKRLPVLNPNEVVLGKLLGRGGFYDVFEVTNVVLKDDKNKGRNDDTARPRYAVKLMRKDVVRNRNKYLTAVKDIVTETHLMSSLDHANVAKIRAVVPCDDVDVDRGISSSSSSNGRKVSAGGVNGVSLMDRIRETGQNAGHAVLMDRLSGTLADRMNEWRAAAAKEPYSSPFGRKSRRRVTLREKLSVIRGLAEAVSHLHVRNVLYRDLKPGNVGFDRDGSVRVFDFGLAREIVSGSPTIVDDDGRYRYRLSVVGTPRYMSPEVMRGEPYESSIDAYSFGVLAWEIFANKKAFEGWPFKRLRNRAASGGHENDNDGIVGLTALNSNVATFNTRALIVKCCSFDWRARPTFKEIESVLRTELARL